MVLRGNGKLNENSDMHELIQWLKNNKIETLLEDTTDESDHGGSANERYSKPYQPNAPSWTNKMLNELKSKYLHPGPPYQNYT